jgi:hypothetical protein
VKGSAAPAAPGIRATAAKPRNETTPFFHMMLPPP